MGPVRAFTSGTLSIVPLDSDEASSLRPRLSAFQRNSPLSAASRASQQLNAPLSSDLRATPGTSTKPNLQPTGQKGPHSESFGPFPATMNAAQDISNTHLAKEPPSNRVLSLSHKGGAVRMYSADQHHKPRRFLHSLKDPESSLLVSLHGAVTRIRDFPIQISGPSYLSMHRTYATKGDDNVSRDVMEDACVLSCGGQEFALLAFSREDNQLAVVDLDGPSPATQLTLDRPWSFGKKSGVAAVVPMIQSSMFASGGLDHIVHLWDFKCEETFTASPRQLNIRHNSVIQSLLSIRDTSHKLVTAGADCNVNVYDLSSERVASTLKASNPVYHVHPVSSPFCTLLEVAHRELQFELRDHRLVPEKPVLRFGYTTVQNHGRYMKGASLPEADLFACGDRDGNVRLWDLRNVDGPHTSIPCFTYQKILQVIFKQPSQLMVCSELNSIRAIDYAKA